MRFIAHRGAFERRRVDHPRRSFAELLRRKHSIADHAQHGHLADIERCRGFGQSDLASLSAFAFPVDGDAKPFAQSADFALRPTVLTAGEFAGAIENRRNGLVRHHPRQFPHQNLDVLFDRPAAFAGRVLLDLQWRVVTALPMQDHLNPVIFDTHDDFMQDGADNPLARRHCRGRMRPGDLQVSAKAHEMFTLLFAENGLALHIEGFQLIFEPARLDELVVPSAFQFTRNETIVRIHGIVLPPCVRRLKALLLQRQFDLSTFFRCL